ncbi:MAG: isoprenylcysteine carboxylmethyltransferase family protein [Acidobacteriota bacterium]|nr:isoprenylcysteine carboxylmethyltransferase family protein [Acidobacteriota bacterium]
MNQRSAAEWTRLALLYSLLAALAAFSRPRPAELFAGTVLVALGEGLRCWAAGHLVKTRQLVTTGPYRYTRNPLYLGRLLIFTGLAIMARLPWLLNGAVLVAGWAVFFGYYLPRKERIEPARLRDRHGGLYERYADAVPALFPRLRPYPVEAGKWRLSRWQKNREGLTALGLLLLVLLFALRTWGAPRGGG